MPSIFSGASSDDGRKTIRTFNETSVYPVVEPERLLSSVHRMRILQEIKEVTELPDEYFDALYRNLIESFTAFVQILPINNEARLSSILDEGLLRALFVMQVQQKSSKEEVAPLMSYVLFSACLLFDVACVIENRTIVITERGGSFIRIWDPIRESSLPIGGYYRIRRGGGLTPWSCRRSAVALASRLMPHAGYDWIFQNPYAFNMWIALLSEDKEGAGVLSLYMDRAREMLEEFKTNVEYYVQTNIEELESKDTKDADLFLAWYLQQLEKGNMHLLQTANDNTMLITSEVIKLYTSTTTTGKVSEERVVEALKKLGATDGELESFYSARQKALQSAFVKQQHAFGAASSLFGAGREAMETEKLPVAEQPVVVGGKVFMPEDQLRVGGGRIEGAGGKVDAYVVSLTLGGVIIPPAVYNSAVNVVSATSQSQLPSLDTQAKSQDAFQEAAKVTITAAK